MISPKARASTPANRTSKRQLAKYPAKRYFKLTPEPNGDAKKGGAQSKHHKLALVIQKHAASRLHYDFRLEWDGVLKSWAVAKGPGDSPGDKRLAIQVEDHPLEYGGFEGIIPKGQYGGGTVMLWDRGTWEPVGDAAEGLRKGNLKFVLHGEKLHGHWVLVRMAGKFAGQSKPGWLLIKEHDGDERGADEVPIIDEAPSSVLSRRDINAIAKAKDAVWNSRDGPSEDRKPSMRPKAHPPIKQRASRQDSSLPNLPPRLADLAKEALPNFISPQLASMAKSPPNTKDWVHELKLDGYRIQARVQAGAHTPVKLLTRTALDWTHRLRTIAEAISTLPLHSALFDGEVVVLANDGTTSFADLQAAFQQGALFSLTYFIFDLLHLDGRNLRNLPLLERKEILADILSDMPRQGSIRLCEHLGGDAQAVFDIACKLGSEGIISKRTQGKYVSGRSNGWLKLKCYREQEFVIGGFTLPSNGIHGIGALLLGYYKNGRLLYAGRTGTGFNQKTHRILRDRLEAIRGAGSPFATFPAGLSHSVHWVRPALVAQVAFANWTTDNLLRQAAFKGLREDKPPKSVHREEEKLVPQKREATKSETKPVKRQTARDRQISVSADSSGSLPVRLTHPDKMLDTDSGLTKDGLAHYYAAVASHMLTRAGGRPLSLVLCMNGISKPCFFQKHANEALPPNIESTEVVDKKTGKPEPYITLSSPEAVVE